ncbi:MAG: IMP cyclohydrolase [Salinirussus sp.]
MYIGRFLVAGPTVGAYRVSSRSFPNRRAAAHDERVVIEPTADAPATDNPYIAYNCLRLTERGAVLGNGSHVDPIAEKLALGTPARDALAGPLGALDFEKDDYDTPRIAGIVGIDNDDPTAGSFGAAVGIIRRDALLVEAVSEPTLVATYEHDSPEAFAFQARDAAEAATEIFDLDFEHRVCAAAVAAGDRGFDVAIENGD